MLVKRADLPPFKDYSILCNLYRTLYFFGYLVFSSKSNFLNPHCKVIFQKRTFNLKILNEDHHITTL